ncbi:MAG: hypothetical protein KGQ49_01480 [Verrucomicrobia bacterium]|nr:hypothetical protein [Verrucomicrobiota bacterium]MBU6446053.1 hypothetical protein [Verrucomicrobiota bacterium]MDE3046954.1 hypothetical protein [Verrucomicrobiota bacterium]
MGAQNDLLAQSEQVLYDVTGIWCVDPTADSAVQEQQKAALAAYCEDLAQNRIGPIDPRLPRRPMIFERIAPPPPPAGFPAFAGSPGRA